MATVVAAQLGQVVVIQVTLGLLVQVLAVS
jgi:hypothetical protein